MAYLSDDGTLDTVVVCNHCGREHRFNYEPADDTDPGNDETTTGYDDFVDECIAEVDDTCECLEAADEPEESDITTSDHRTFYQDGRLVLEYDDETGIARSVKEGKTWRVSSVEQALSTFMVHTQFWPNCWFISDHGNAHRIEL